MATAALNGSTSRGFELAYASPIISESVLREMGADMASLHRHNSKMSLPRALNDEAGKLSEDGRKRRSYGSSDDEGKIAEDGFSNEDLRVGGPYLCSIPFTIIHPPYKNPLDSLLFKKVSGEKTISYCIRQILQDRNVSVIETGRWSQPLGVVFQQSKFNPEPEPVPTVVIFAIRHVVDDSWLQAARQIHLFLRQENFGHVSVQIADPKVYDPPMTFPVTQSDPMFNKWDSVLARILREVDLTEIQLIGCYRRGRGPGKENPVTVLVIADANSKKCWRATRDLIAGILKHSNLPMVAVEIVRDRKMPLRDLREGFKEEILTGRAMVGGPIANSRNDMTSGTLGGFIELQDPSTLKWSCFALTCFHVIDPHDRYLGDEELAAVQKWRSRGLSMLDAKNSAEASLAQQCLKTSHPSQRAKQEQIDEYQTRIKHDRYWDEVLKAEGKDGERDHSYVRDLEKKIEDIQGFFQNSGNILGHVRCALGLRSKTFYNLDGEDYPTTLDWALVEVDVAKPTLANEVFQEEIAPPEYLSWLSTRESNCLRFQGYQSGRNDTRYNVLKVARIEEGRCNLEYSIVKHSDDEYGRVAKKGDAGSLLSSPSPFGEVIGMIIDGYEYSDIALFTRMDDLVKDIMEQSGAADIRMWEHDFASYPIS